MHRRILPCCTSAENSKRDPTLFPDAHFHNWGIGEDKVIQRENSFYLAEQKRICPKLKVCQVTPVNEQLRTICIIEHVWEVFRNSLHYK